MEFIEGLFGFIAVVFGLLLVIVPVTYLMEKFMGMKIYGGWASLVQGERDEEQVKQELIELQKKNPELVEKAIVQCKKKKFTPTYTNVLNEVYQIVNEKENLSN